MSSKIFLSFLFFLLVLSLLFFYWFFPYNEISFSISNPGHSNFTLNSSFGESMQFYENMRYPDSKISYRIEKDCTLGKKDEMKRSLNWIENKTILKFYEVNYNEEIIITCEDSSPKGREGAFIAGEGGVTNVTITENFNVILNGMVLLIRESKCPNPIVGTHELLHALGFGHSENPNNIMYPTVNCKQTIGEDLINSINYLYSFPSLPDLSFEDASAILRGRYLDVNMTIRNNGLIDSDVSKVLISADGKTIKEFVLDPIKIGTGRSIILTNLFILNRVNNLEISIIYANEELDKKNNKIILEMKGD